MFIECIRDDVLLNEWDIPRVGQALRMIVGFETSFQIERFSNLSSLLTLELRLHFPNIVCLIKPIYQVLFKRFLQKS